MLYLENNMRRIFLIALIIVMIGCSKTIQKTENLEKNEEIALFNEIIPESYLTELNKEDLRVYRNTIYAKYGYIFKTTDLREYFSQFSWYKGEYEDVDHLLTVVDRLNIENIQKYERYLTENVTNAMSDLIDSQSYVSNEKDFDFKNGWIYGYNGKDQHIRIPEYINGELVHAISAVAFCTEGTLRCSNEIISIYIPETIETILQMLAFDNSTLTNIQVSERNINFSSMNGILYNKNSTILLKYPTARTGEFIIPEKVIELAMDSFIHCNIENVIINNGLQIIRSCAFYGCRKLSNITLPDTLISIESSAFFFTNFSDTIKNNIIRLYGTDVFKEPVWN